MSVIERTSVIPVDVHRLFEFHCVVGNVRIVTPGIIPVTILDAPEYLAAGDSFTISVGLGRFALPWDVRVAEIIVDRLLIDEQHGRGPYAQWRHEHRFMPSGTQSLLTDRVEYEMPFGIAGRILDLLLFRALHHLLFWYRHRRTIHHFSRA